jgi:glycine dehydrogenase subunit 1
MRSHDKVKLFFFCEVRELFFYLPFYSCRFLFVPYNVPYGFIEFPVDIAIGEGQALGNPLSFGGPYLGFMACREALQRKLPGRIVGETADFEGTRGYVLTLQAREQHIRREKASSNICSNQALNALAASVYLAAMGPQGLREAAELSTERAHAAAEAITGIPGMALKHSGAFFKEFVIESTAEPEEIERALTAKGILPGLPLGFLGSAYRSCMLYCCTETNTPQGIDALVDALKEVGK